jgi:arsenate reductase
MPEKIYNVLILCTGNSARSIMAEALINMMGNGRFHAYSAGSTPTGKVNPLAIEKARSIKCPVENLRSKSSGPPHSNSIIHSTLIGEKNR